MRMCLRCISLQLQFCFTGHRYQNSVLVTGIAEVLRVGHSPSPWRVTLSTPNRSGSVEKKWQISEDWISQNQTGVCGSFFDGNLTAAKSLRRRHMVKSFPRQHSGSIRISRTISVFTWILWDSYCLRPLAYTRISKSPIFPPTVSFLSFLKNNGSLNLISRIHSVCVRIIINYFVVIV